MPSPAPDLAPFEPLYVEKKLAEKLALSRDLLQYARGEALTKKDWRKEGREIVLTQAGLARLLAYIRATHHADLPADYSDCLLLQKNGAEGPTAHTSAPTAPTNELVEFTVARVLANSRLLLGRDPAGELRNVQVPDNRNFVPGMRLRARPAPPPAIAGTYRLEGRCPRTKGRY